MKQVAISICPDCDIELTFDAEEDNWYCPNCFEDYTIIDEDEAPSC